MTQQNLRAPRPHQNEHHLAYPRTFYVAGWLKRFRALPCMRVWMDIDDHNQLHAESLRKGTMPKVPKPQKAREKVKSCMAKGCTMQTCVMKGACDGSSD